VPFFVSCGTLFPLSGCGMSVVLVYVFISSVHYPFSSGRILVDELPNFIVNGESVLGSSFLFF